ncbi:hypothetical protein [Paenibacillus contaminans]|jgi:hypothetical protein|uniref:Uncharacterized protein n=1 Tax=Paenibacillus contaminans TaxID=450362 RepID=A0A329MRN7_9BACL|nr:hypothetical protein [Paenibacillus contaminans]RAV20607.1 hypothetical protein DQG23_13915 [Paenibacillus contaminans]
MAESTNHETEASEPKKVSLADAVRNKLAQKKQAQSNDSNIRSKDNAAKKVASQMTKKVNNQRRRTGGS